MVFFQSLPRINKNLLKKNILSLDAVKNSKEIMDDLVKNPSFSLVCLFLKFYCGVEKPGISPAS